MNHYYSVQVRISQQVKRLAEERAREEGMTLKAWIEEAIRKQAKVNEARKTSA